MKNNWTAAPMGDLCRLEKGVSATMKTEPGEFPLVVTAAYRRTSNEYQFSEPAACIPIVSSTGHGNASIHRIHYEDGKFALANLLVAVIPKDSSVLDTKYLWRYLSVVKDTVLVPLMQGTANVTLKPDDLLGVEVLFPPLPEQQRIVAHLDAIEARLSQVQKLREMQEQELLAALRSSFHKIEEESEWLEMGDVAPLQRRQIEIEPDGSYPELGARSFGKGIFHKPTLNGVDLTWQKLFRVQTGDIVFSNIKAWEGAIAVAGADDDGRYGSHRYLTCVADPTRALPEFICFYLLSAGGLEKVGAASVGSADRNRTLSTKRLEKITVPVPSLSLQREFKKLLDLRLKIQQEAKRSMERSAALLPSLLDRVFNT